MNKTVYGVYESNVEVIAAINELKAKGFEGDDITVVADKEETLAFTTHQRETDVDVNTITNETNEDSFMDKVARFFMPDENANLSTRLADAGLSSSEAAEHVYDVERGKILILIEEDKNHLTAPRDSFKAGTENTTGTTRTTLDTNSENPLFNKTEKSGLLKGKDTVMNGSGRGTTEDEKTIRLREEQLNIDKERVQAGEVVIDKEVKEEHKTINVPVEREEVTIERRPVTGHESDLEAGRINEGETVRIPVVEEKLEVTKKPVVTDEIVIKKQVVESTEQVQDTLKKEDIQLKNSDSPFVREESVDALNNNTDLNDKLNKKNSLNDNLNKKNLLNKKDSLNDADFPANDLNEDPLAKEKRTRILEEQHKLR